MKRRIWQCIMALMSIAFSIFTSIYLIFMVALPLALLYSMVALPLALLYSIGVFATMPYNKIIMALKV